jgi:betaine reductase
LAKELERAGVTTALVCNLVSIASRVGAPRIVAARGIPYPTGDPSLSPDQERRWRRQLVERALQVLTVPVAEPTVFSVEGSSDG